MSNPDYDPSLADSFPISIGGSFLMAGYLNGLSDAIEGLQADIGDCDPDICIECWARLQTIEKLQAILEARRSQWHHKATLHCN